jgi:hypothetical protein
MYTIFDSSLLGATEGGDLFYITLTGFAPFLSQCQIRELEPARALFH